MIQKLFDRFRAFVLATLFKNISIAKDIEISKTDNAVLTFPMHSNVIVLNSTFRGKMK